MNYLDRVRESAGGEKDLLTGACAYAGGVLWTLGQLGLISGPEWRDLGDEVVRRLGLDPNDVMPLPT